MPATPIRNPVSGERLLGIEPQLLQQVDPGWRHRLNLFTGRALSDTALDGEQLYRAGLLATLGQAVTPGTVTGLVLSLDARPSDPVLTVTPGYGIGATGEDVSLPRTLQTALSTLDVLDPVTGDVVEPFATYRTNAANNRAGVFVLQSVVGQVSGQAFDTGTGPIEVSGNLGASCDQDPQEYAFEDWQIADGVRLAFVPWPSGVGVLQLPAPAPAATWRNRLAYTIFDAEARLGPDDAFPWMMIGVPLALVAFDTAWTPLFIDRSSVVRAGGLPRRRSVLPSAPPAAPGAVPPTWRANTAYAVAQSILDPQGAVQTVLVGGESGSSEPDWNDLFLQTADNTVIWVNNGTTVPPIVQPALAQARIAQLAEQVGDQLAQTTVLPNLATGFAVLPPSGIVPAAALDFVNKRSAWFPRNWSLSAAPVHLEELEAVLRTAMLADPIPTSLTVPSDPKLLEDVDILVPLPDEVYDPHILVTETVSPEFQHEIDTATRSRNATLHARKAVQLQLNALAAVVGPNVPSNPGTVDLNAGLTPAERAGRDTLPPSFPQPNANANLDQTFGTIGPATWQAAASYVLGQFVYDPNGNIQRVANAGGTSGATQPVWNATPGATTTDGPIGWFNAGPGTWRANTAYVAGQFVYDPNGSLQTVAAPGTSGPSPYIWNAKAGGRTADGGVTWVNNGLAAWQPNHPYNAGSSVVDANGNLQVVQSPGTSGAAAPPWATDAGEGTSDGPQLVWINEGRPTIWEPKTAYVLHQMFTDQAGNLQEVAVAGVSGWSQLIWKPTSGQQTADGPALKWLNGGPGTWQPATAYTAGQFVLDANGNTQHVTGAGTSGTSQPAWNATVGKTTADAGVRWTNDGPGTWRANTVFTPGQFVFDPNGNVQTATVGAGKANGTTGATPPAWATADGQQTTDGTIVWVAQSWVSADLMSLRTHAAAAPYTFTYTDPAGTHTVRLISADDWADLQSYGLQHFINRLNAKVKRANDLLDLAFLTSQTDIYRFRQNVLTTIDASKLATSPVLANIATGATAAATAEQLRDYFAASSKTSVSKTVGAAAVAQPLVAAQPAPAPGAASAAVETSGIAERALFVQTSGPATSSLNLSSSGARTVTGLTGTTAAQFSLLGVQSVIATSPTAFVEAVSATPTVTDIREQSPIVGAQLDVRTLTIAERLAQSPSQEAMFYAVSNRTAFMQALLDLEITLDDLQFLVDATPSSASVAIPTETHFLSELRGHSKAALFTKIQTPYVPTDVDEAGLFSTGVRSVEQHTQLMRALEARVQLYADFVSLCTTARTNLQKDVQNARTLLSRLENDLAQVRQDLAFTTALLGDEQQRVKTVNAQRAQVLQTAVSVVVYARPRTLEGTENVPSRQLVPGNVASPVPACLAQPVTVPPELREIVALLRDAPVTWLPSVRTLLNGIGLPSVLQQVAADVQSHAALALRMPLKASSALIKPDVYAPAIANMYVAHQQMFRSAQTERAAFMPAALANQSWTSQVAMLANIMAVGDAVSSAAVHSEIVNATSLLMQQIASVAGCVYARANVALPVDRLAWAEFLRGPGASVQLRSLAVLPNWNTQPYLDRQQMQLLVDWLFQQIDPTIAAAAAFMSDVVRTAILLASHAPVGAVIAGAVATRKQPVVGNVISLTMPSQSIASGMYVQLYSKGVLAAEAVVSDLDTTSVSATVTTVHQPGVFLEANDVAHFTTQAPQVAALLASAR